MILLEIAYPAFLLSLACLGYGLPGMILCCRDFATLPIVFRLVAGYFFGQSLLAVLFVALALRGAFTFTAVLTVVVLGLVLAAGILWMLRGELHSAVKGASKGWLRAPYPWRVIAVLTAVLFIYGISSMGRRTLDADATAFYMAAAKLIAHTGRLDILPGYESFSWVIMTGEILYASLMLLGSPGTGARFYEWINFLPALLAMYWVARRCGLRERAAFLAALMMLTSSAAIALWGGGKTDTFAVGPALIGVWFALASWKSDHRTNSMALSGLFCGFAIAAKFSYLIPLLPGVILLIHWNGMIAAIEDIKASAWEKLFPLVWRTALGSIWFLGFVALGLCPFLVKNLIIFHGPIGPGGSLASSKWYSDQTIRRLMLSYPAALTYGRYWAQAGTLSPLILAFFPLLFLIPRQKRRLSSPLAAMTISTIAAIAIWMALMPSIFMPRYFLATLLLLAIPAAAGAAYVSRGRTALAVAVVCATTFVIICTPSHVMTRSRILSPGRAIDYFRDGDEERTFVFDPTLPAISAVNKLAEPDARVLLLIYSRLWLRGDLLAATSTSTEMGRATELLEKRDPEFWTYLQDRRFTFLVVGTAQLEDLAVLAKAMPRGMEFCQIKQISNVTSLQIGKSCGACPPGKRETLHGPFVKPWPDGNAYVANYPDLEAQSDTEIAPYRSPLALCEGDTTLWPAHSSEQSIRAEGGGRFSHRDMRLIFSASDNSDPNTNGRTYTVVRPEMAQTR